MQYLQQHSKFPVKDRLTIYESFVSSSLPNSHVDFYKTIGKTMEITVISDEKDEDLMIDYVSALFPEYDYGTVEISERLYKFSLRAPNLIEIEGDLLDQNGYLVQQCNCVTIKAHGLAQSFIDRFGKVADLYGKRKTKTTIPGTYQIVSLGTIPETKMLAIFGQWLPGKANAWNRVYRTMPTVPDTCEVRLQYFKKALDQFLQDKQDDLPVYFPYKIGCGLAGGDWNQYKQLIQEFAKNCNSLVYVVQLK